jgi:octaprenyl-diphosphate synthase
MNMKIRSVVESDFLAVNDFIVDQLYSEVDLVENIGHYIVEAGGKRMRPLLVLLSSRACGIKSDEHIAMAAVIEFIHTATLLHDDVVDMSSLRRGRPTVNAEWNNPSSVLVGDFIYSRSFQILVAIGDMKIMEIIADTTNKIAEGEVLQLLSKSNPDSSEADYMRVIENKTAILFQAAGECGAILAGADQAVATALQKFGRHLGIAFQLIDDVLDYDGDTDELGKNVGDDLAEGKPTLPLVYAMQNADDNDLQLIRRSLLADNIDQQDLRDVIQIVGDSGALDYTRDLAEKQAEMARTCLQAVPDSEYRQALHDMVDFSINRSS